MSMAKKILIVIGPLVLIGMLIWSMRGGVDLPDSYTWVDVRTGKLVEWGRTEQWSVPAKSRDDGVRAMFPVSDQNGTWVVETPYRPALVDFAARYDGELAVDLRTFEVIGG
jgi:hypothetical protein